MNTADWNNYVWAALVLVYFIFLALCGIAGAWYASKAKPIHPDDEEAGW